MVTSLLLLAWGSVHAGAQNPPDNTAAKKAAAKPEVSDATPSNHSVATPIEEIKPEVYYLRNKDGELVYVPNFSFEKWEQLIRLARNLAEPPHPTYVFQQMAITGQVHNNQAHLKIVFRIQQRAKTSVSGAESKSVWVRVPLRLQHAILVSAPTFSGPGEHFITFDPGGDGYVLWIQAKPDTQHEVTLELQQPVRHVATQRELTLELPTPLVSTLALQVPEPHAEGTVVSRSDNVTQSLEFTPHGDSGGTFSARGLRGDVTLQWHPTQGSNAAKTLQLDVFGAIVVTADEPLSEVRSDGRFVVRSFGAPIERFRVRMPPGMRFREAPEPGYSVHVVPNQDPKAKAEQVEVQLDRPTNGEVHIRLVAELPPDQNGTATGLTVKQLIDRNVQLEPARFEFIGAVRHRGNVELVVKGDWELHWTTDPNLPRVGTGSSQLASQFDTTRFTYFRQPCDLKVMIRRKATRVSIEPTYDVRLDIQQIRLAAVFVCRTSGTQTPPLAIRLRGWTVETVQFDEGETPGSIDLNQVNPLVVPIPSGIQAIGRFVLRIEARRELTAGVISGTQPLRIELPTVESANPSRANLIVSPATVTITPAENVAITPRPKEIQGLAPLALAPETPEGDMQQSVLRYRDQGGSETASFVCDFRVRPRSISVAIDSNAKLTADSMTVDQHLTYTVQHEPLSTLTLSVPKRLVDNQRLKARVLWNDQPLALLMSAPLGEDRVVCEAMLPEPLLGTADLRVQIPRQSLTPPADGRTWSAAIPLVFPAPAQPDTTVIDNRVTITYDQSLDVKLVSGPWAKDENESQPGKMYLTTASDGADVVLQITAQQRQQTAATAVLQAWLQTWLVGPDRHDRAVFHIRTAQRELTVDLPQVGTRPVELMRALVDGTAVQPTAGAQRGRLQIALEAAKPSAQHDHVVELWYRIPGGRPSGTRWTLAAATVVGTDRTTNGYWQLILAPNDIVLAGDGNCLLERYWRWSWLGWRRVPVQEQRELEDLLGASHQDPVPSNTNRYLFMTFGVPRSLHVTTVARSFIVLVMSGGVLVVGFLFLYVPLLRRPLTFVVIGVIVLALAAWAPDTAIVLGQATVLGFVLVGLAILLRKLLRPAKGMSVLERSAVLRDSKMLEPQFNHSGGSSRIAHGGSSRSTSLPTTDLET